MPKNLNDPGRPSPDLGLPRRQAEGGTYVEWTPDVNPWMDDAACLGMLDWVDADPKSTRPICLGDPKRRIAPCPVLRQCREWVLSRPAAHSEFGVWAGMTRRQQAELRAKIADQAAKQVAA